MNVNKLDWKKNDDGCEKKNIIIEEPSERKNIYTQKKEGKIKINKNVWKNFLSSVKIDKIMKGKHEMHFWELWEGKERKARHEKYSIKTKEKLLNIFLFNIKKG